MLTNIFIGFISSILVSVELNVVKEVMDGPGNSGNGAEVGDDISGNWSIEIFVSILIFIHSGILLYFLIFSIAKDSSSNELIITSNK